MFDELPLVLLEQATVSTAAGRVLGGIDLAIWAGQCVQILGQTGQGKSLLLEVLAGRHRLSRGTLRYPAFENEFADASLGIAPRFAVRLVSSEEQRRLATSLAS